jgi:serine protease
MKQLFRAFLVLGALLLTVANSDARDRAPSNKPVITVTPHAPGVVYVKMREGSSSVRTNTHGIAPQSAGGSLFSDVLSKLRATETVPFDANAPKDAITHNLGIDRMYVIYYSNRAIDPQQALQMLIATGEVECGSVRYMFPVSLTPNDTYLSQEYAVSKMHLKNAWDVTIGDSNVLIADVDDGFNTTHEDLKNAIKIGYDAVGNVGAGEKFEPDTDPQPDYFQNSHGTHTGGCIAATGNNKVGIAGSGYGCRLIAIKAAGNEANNISGGYEGIHYASTHGARVINCSWGGPVTGDQTFANTFLFEAQQRNALIVAASGNGDANGNAINNDIK